jgi:hypothetical protein
VEIDRAHLQDLYFKKTDAELLRLAANYSSLTEDAQQALGNELQRRNIRWKFAESGVDQQSTQPNQGRQGYFAVAFEAVVTAIVSLLWGAFSGVGLSLGFDPGNPPKRSTLRK